MRVLHLIPDLTSESFIVTCSLLHALGKRCEQRLAALRSTAEDREALRPLFPDIELLDPNDNLDGHLEQADVLHVIWRNDPLLLRWLSQDHPKRRAVAWLHAVGDEAPHYFLPEFVDYFDRVVAAHPRSLNLPAFARLTPAQRAEKLRLVLAPVETPVLPVRAEGGAQPVIGTHNLSPADLEFVDLHSAPEFAGMHFLATLRGNGARRSMPLFSHAALRGLKGRVRFIESDDGEPLQSASIYSEASLAPNSDALCFGLKKAMLWGKPTVVRRGSGHEHLVLHGQTGLVASDDAEYASSISLLARNEFERSRLGASARQLASHLFSPANAANSMLSIFLDAQTLEKSSRTIDIPRRPGENPVLDGGDLLAFSLGKGGHDYARSLRQSDPLQTIIDAEERISESSFDMITDGVVAYRNEFPESPHLRLWAGLIALHNRNFDLAISELSTTLNSLKEARVCWYLGLAAWGNCRSSLALECFSAVQGVAPFSELAPRFIPALNEHQVAVPGGDLLGREALLFKEVECVGLDYAGSSKLWNVLFELDLCHSGGNIAGSYTARDGRLYLRPNAYFLTDLLRRITPETIRDGFTFPEPITVTGQHMLLSRLADRKMIRVVRDGRDMMVSRWKAMAALISSTDASDALDSPLAGGGGSLFSLGLLEEWILQEKLVQSAIVPSCPGVFSVRFEDLSGENAQQRLSALLEFLGVHRSPSQIKEALAWSSADVYQLDRKGNSGGGAIGKWKDAKFKCFVQRFGLLCQTLGSPHPYELGPINAAQELDWPTPEFRLAARHWIQHCLMRLRRGLSDRFNYETFTHNLIALCSIAAEVPLLEVELCRQLLRHSPESAPFARAKLETLIPMHRPLLQLQCLAALLEHTRDDRTLLARFTAVLNEFPRAEHPFVLETLIHSHHGPLLRQCLPEADLRMHHYIST